MTAKSPAWWMVPLLGAIFVACRASPAPRAELQPSQPCEKLTEALRIQERLAHECSRGPARSAGPAAPTRPCGPKDYCCSVEYRMRSYEADKAVDEIEEQMGSQGASCYCSRDPAQCHVPQPRELELCENVARTNQAHENAEAALEESDSDNMYDVIHTPPRNAEEAASLKRLREANQAIELTEKAADEAEAEASAQGINCENIVEGWRASPTPCGEPGPNPLCEKLAKAMEESDAQRHQEPVCAAPVNTQGAAVIQWLPSCPEWTDWKKRGDEAQRAIDQVKAQMRSDGTTCFCAQHGTLWRCRPGCSREAELCKQLDAANQAYSQAMAGAHEFAPCYSPCEPIGTGLPGMPKAPVGIADIPGVAPSVMEEKRSRIREARGVLDEARAKVDAEKFDCQGFQPEQ